MQNSHPVVSAIADRAVSVGGSATVAVTDADAGAHTVAASSSAAGVATVSVSRKTLTVTGVAAGAATITVAAPDDSGASNATSASVAFSARVTSATAPDAPTVTAPSREGLNKVEATIS